MKSFNVDCHNHSTCDIMWDGTLSSGSMFLTLSTDGEEPTATVCEEVDGQWVDRPNTGLSEQDVQLLAEAIATVKALLVQATNAVQ